MAHILISPLGKGMKDREYEMTKYKFVDSDEEYESSLIASVLSEHLQVDKIFLIGTRGSMWEEVFRYFGEADQNEERAQIYLELSEKIHAENGESALTEDDLLHVSEVLDLYLKKKNPGATGGSVCKIIQHGADADELYQNFVVFMELQKQIQPGDYIHLDITHSFRSIPIFMFLIVDFIHHLRTKDDIQLAGVYYGMKEGAYAPIVDLSPLFNVTQWTKGVYDFTNYGNVHSIAKLMEDSNVKESMSTISKLTSLNDIKMLRSEVDRLRGQLTASHDPSAPDGMIFHYVKPHIEEFVNYFRGASNDAEFQFKLAKWFFDHERYSNGYICLAESMITSVAYICRKIRPSFSYTKKRDREKIRELLNKQLQKVKDDDLIRASELYEEVKKIRNNIAHAGFLRSESYYDVINNVQRYIKQTERLFFSSYMTDKIKKFLENYITREA